ncbi:SgcJ/EcaC family oxidoreductase [Salininema proteolyticum]|uniref:SgcJ/EcaC family oxidoreductase n=1 Tax=Salininema proteolyticum TaxID=1607685 RepID=A0ABV8TTV6_9ACTN
MTDAALRDLYEQLLLAWNRRDAEAYAALFSPNALLVGFDGSQVSGRDIASHLTPIFADHPTAPYVWKIREIRALTPDTALLYAIAGMVPSGSDDLEPELNAVQTLVARKSDTWTIELFQNTPAQYHGNPSEAERHTSQLRRVLRP